MLFTMPSWKQVGKDVHQCWALESHPQNHWTDETVPIAEMWKAIKRLKQGESINVQDLETKVYWSLEKFTFTDGESLESYYSREWKKFVTLVKQSQELKIVSYHKLYDLLKQHQNEINKIRPERLAHTANLRALVDQQQPVYHPQNHPNHYTHNSSTKLQQAATRNRGKAIINYPLPTYDQEPEMVAEDDALSKEKEIDKLMALVSLSFKKSTNLPTTTSELHQTPVEQIRMILHRLTEALARECKKPKQAKDAAYHKGKMLLCKQEEAGFQLNAEQSDWRDDTDDEPDDQELEAHYIEHPEQPESVNDIYLEEQEDTNITIDSIDMSTNEETVDQADDDLARERDLLASFIEKLKSLQMSQPANDEFSQHLSDDEASNHEDASDTGAAPKQQQQVIPQTTAISNIKLPILKKEEYDIWAMEMEHYLEYIDNDVWKVIQNGNSKKRISTGKDGVIRILPPVTAAEIQAVEKERKAKNILLMAIPKEHMRRFHGMDDAKEIWEAIRTRFGGNANSKKMQKAVFKQQFEAFTISSSEGLEKGYDRFQQLLSQLEAHGAEVSTEDANHKFLRSLPPAWSNLAMTMRTKPDVEKGTYEINTVA
ncbi:hypothetical protein Tco_0449469 [Tanacetum coccineum]